MRGLPLIAVAFCWLLLAACALPDSAPPGGGSPQPRTQPPASCPAGAPAGLVPTTSARPLPSSPTEVFGAPLVITDGGTYRGNWESQDPDVAALEIDTSDPVIIEGSNIRSRGPLIVGGVERVNLTVRDSTAEGLNPGRPGQTAGRFVFLHDAANVVVENNDILGTSGIKLDGYGGTPGQGTFRIVNNRATNIDGRLSTGSGYSADDSTAEYVQFVQLAMVGRVPGIEVGWNDVYNAPGASRVEDVISVYLSGGTAQSPISIHDNYIDGAYPTNARTDSRYTGGGIMLGDGDDDPRHRVEYAQATGNTVVNTSNYGIAVSSGHHLEIRGNRVLSTGLLPGGEAVAAQNVGLYVLNIYDQRRFGPIDVADNLVGWEVPKKGDRNDYYTPGARQFDNNNSLPTAVGVADIRNEYDMWSCRAAAAQVVVGPRL